MPLAGLNSSNLLRFALKLAISAALIGFIISRLDLSDLSARIKAVSVTGALLVMLALLMQCIVASLRWEWIIRTMGHTFPFLAALRVWLIGLFIGQGFPSTIGQDAYRVMSLRRGGVPALVALEIIVLDRFTGLVALVALAAATLPILFELASNKAPLIPVALVVGGSMLAILLLFSPLSVSGLVTRFPRLEFLSRFRSNLKRLAKSRHDMLWMLVPALTAHLLTVLAAYIIARDAGSRIGLLQCLAIIPSAILISFIPLSIAGWGIREGAIVAGAVLLGLPASDALFISVMLGVGFMAVGAIGGLVWLTGGGIRPADQALHADVVAKRESNAG